MNRLRPIFAGLLTVFMMAPPSLAQTPAQATPMSKENRAGKPDVPVAPGAGLWSGFSRPYREAVIAEVSLNNSPRLETLIRAGKLYLSLEDALALAIENNLDVELARYGPQLAQVDLLRAQAGGLLRGVPGTIRQVQSSALSSVTGGTGGSAGGASGLGGSGGGSGSGTEGGVGGTVITQTGVAVPSLDPVFSFSGFAGHNSRPQSNTVTTGTTALQFDNKGFNAAYSQNFLTGTALNYSWSNTKIQTNNPRVDLNPFWQPNMNLSISQRLMQGFGLAVNNRNIRVARNNLKVSDLTFKLQVMTTVSGVVNLYWDLVSFNEDLKVKQKALEVARKFHEDNKKQVEIGTLAPIEIVRAEARVAQAEQELTNSETSLLQQETIVKNALSRSGIASPAVAEARVVPTDTLALPRIDSIEPLADLTERAIKNRPDIQQLTINLENTRIGLAGAKSQLLPSLDVQASFQNNSLAGQLNTLYNLPGGPGADPFFIGGYGSALGQIFRRNFPDYSIGFQLNIPLRNRQAQADYVRDRLAQRQQELTAQRQVNELRVTVQNALTAVLQARARYQAAVKERQLQEQTLDAENKKYALGASTAFQVVQTQRDFAQSQASEVAALAAYSRSRVQLDLTTAQILDRYKVEVAEALTGKSSRPMDPPVIRQ
ncbi:MAG: transporter [Candidatus Solibacter sp.]|nr:transporter [Candidatus Solibacter sp.]